MRKLIKSDISVLRALKTGQAHKTTSKELTAITGINTRALYDAIEALRNAGIPIMASRNNRDSGYYIAQTEEEKQAGIAQYKRQIATEQRSLSQLQQTNVNAYLSRINFDPVVWSELSSELLEVIPTSDGAIVKLKNKL